ncbi:pyrimidine 5'-nucleotidase [Caulobacter sp. 17J80-11]|uniref:pyrimidine 5'-nucleotidase n=1 Tax=Caulobacter sp. 17J80-11 TaxID=2763502 RepID=UPI00165346AC|nr:pyrimidine 5'-nucleotidase [Caulobacter sp. 17J80-11]MBC6982513.1 pyrimidine 5'-nucleotidase [Caulobacter sp. 17J80-11]
MSADLSRVETWIFDLDNTLYPAECEYMALIEGKMTAFVMRETGLPRDEAKALQKRYLHEHGTTLAGLMAHHGVDPRAFLDEVHDVAMDRLTPDPALLAALARLPGRRLVFTNGGSKHAERVLERLQIGDLFEDVFHLEAADFVPKPAQATYENLVRIHGVDPRAAAFFEDSERNLKPAAVLGMATVLVGAHAALSSADFVHHRTDKLPPFLMNARIRTAA